MGMKVPSMGAQVTTLGESVTVSRISSLWIWDVGNHLWDASNNQETNARLRFVRYLLMGLSNGCCLWDMRSSNCKAVVQEPR